jgi:hypothetical protein
MRWNAAQHMSETAVSDRTKNMKCVYPYHSGRHRSVYSNTASQISGSCALTSKIVGMLAWTYHTPMNLSKFSGVVIAWSCTTESGEHRAEHEHRACFALLVSECSVWDLSSACEPLRDLLPADAAGSSWRIPQSIMSWHGSRLAQPVLHTTRKCLQAQTSECLPDLVHRAASAAHGAVCF